MKGIPGVTEKYRRQGGVELGNLGETGKLAGDLWKALKCTAGKQRSKHPLCASCVRSCGLGTTAVASLTVGSEGTDKGPHR